jgi:hypothetical protein
MSMKSTPTAPRNGRPPRFRQAAEAHFVLEAEDFARIKATADRDAAGNVSHVLREAAMRAVEESEARARGDA